MRAMSVSILTRGSMMYTVKGDCEIDVGGDKHGRSDNTALSLKAALARNGLYLNIIQPSRELAYETDECLLLLTLLLPQVLPNNPCHRHR